MFQVFVRHTIIFFCSDILESKRSLWIRIVMNSMNLVKNLFRCLPFPFCLNYFARVYFPLYFSDILDFSTKIKANNGEEETNFNLRDKMCHENKKTKKLKRKKYNYGVLFNKWKNLLRQTLQFLLKENRFGNFFFSFLYSLCF